MIKKEDIKSWVGSNYDMRLLIEALQDGDYGVLINLIHDCITEFGQDKWDLLDDYHNELLAATKSIFHPHFEGVKGVFESRNNRPELPNDK